MATSGREIDERDRQRIQRLRQAGLSIRQVAKAERVCAKTVQKILRNALAK